MPFWKFITVAEHERIVADVHDAKEIYQREMHKYHDLYLVTKSERDTETRRANALAAELAPYRARREKQLLNLKQNAGKTPVGGE